MTKYHYTYRITNTVEQKHYYGARSSNIHPTQDLGIKYFSSSSDKKFIVEQKLNPQNFKYKVISIFETREEAIALEIKLHSKFNVGVNESFYNKAKQTSARFDTVGLSFNKNKVIVKDNENNNMSVFVTDPKWLSGELVSINKGKFNAVSKDGSEIRLSKDDPRYLSGEYIARNKNKVIIKIDGEFKVINKESEEYKQNIDNLIFARTGKFIVIDKITGIKYDIENDDPRWLSGELVSIRKGMTIVKNIYTRKCEMMHKDEIKTRTDIEHINKGTVTVKDVDGITMKVSVDDKRYKSGELIHLSKNTIIVKDKEGKNFRVSKDDPRWLSGELVSVNKGKFNAVNKEGLIIRLSKDDPRWLSGEYITENKGKIVVRDNDGKFYRVSKDDPRYISGELYVHNKQKGK